MCYFVSRDTIKRIHQLGGKTRQKQIAQLSQRKRARSVLFCNFLKLIFIYKICKIRYVRLCVCACFL